MATNATSIIVLSGSTQGKGIKVVATSSTGTTIHTTGTSATVVDRLYLYAVNSDTTDRKLTVEFGGTTSPDCLIEITIPAEAGMVQITDGFPLMGNGSVGLTTTAFCASANVVMIYGYVLRVTP